MSNAATNLIEGYAAQLDALTFGLVPVLHLYTNDVVITPESVKDDFAEIVFDGYAPVPLTHWTPARLQEGRAVSYADPVQFVYTGGPVPAPAFGWFITSERDGPVIAAWRVTGDALALGPDRPQLLVTVALLFPPPLT